MRTFVLWAVLGLSTVGLMTGRTAQAGEGKAARVERAALREAVREMLDNKDFGGGKEEAREFLKQLKEKLDADQDGKLNPGEVRAALEKLKENHPMVHERLMKRIEERRGKRSKRDGK